MDEPRVWSLAASEGHPNEDAVFSHDGVAVVVDGAGLPRSMRAGCRHPVAWYSRQLAGAFGEALLLRGLTMPQALGRAIAEVSERHEGCTLEDGSPSATVAAWRLRPPVMEYLVLSDASLVVVTADDVVEVTDDRLGVLVAEELGRLTATSAEPLDATAVLNARAAVLDRARNVDSGFWCCQTDPAAADHALSGSYPLSDLVGVVIATDGATRGFQALGTHTVGDLARRACDGDGASLLAEVRAAERDQSQRLAASATKVHDDATLVALSMTSARRVGPDSPSWRPPATPGDVVRGLGTGEEVTHPTAATVTPVTGAGSSYVVRAYRAGDDAAGTHAAFREAVLRTASSDYDAEQIAAWAGSADVDLARWDARRAAAHTFVAVVGGEVAGFVDFLDDGLVDMLFVHPDHGRTGVARALVQTVQREARSAGLSTLRTHASRTARPAFERLGFRTVKERPHNVVGGRVVPNYEMRYDLHDR